MKNNTGDMPADEFRLQGHKIVDLLADYLENIESYPVVPAIEPGDIYSKLPLSPPASGESMDSILKEFNSTILPGMTHWNHPMFMAYFNSTSSGPGILAEFICAALNANGMIWKTSPALTELEQLTLNWFKDILGFPKELFGIIYDTASISTMHAIACAREQADASIRHSGFNGKSYVVYTSEHAHSSVEKGAVVLGIGIENVKKIKTDAQYKMDVNLLEEEILSDINSGKIPICVSATIGTTSITSVDPVDQIAAICKKYNLWLHVDAAYAGVTAMLPECKKYFNGIEEADSIVVNPHKWLFVPSDLSVFYTKKPDILKSAFSLIPEYLKTNHDSNAINLMDYGVQLGRRFRALKLWFTIKYFGVEGLQNRLRDNIRLANKILSWVNSQNDLQLIAPVNFSTVCFRFLPNSNNDLEKINAVNQKLMELINAQNDILISHTKVNGIYVLRVVTAGLRMTDKHAELAISIFEKCLNQIRTSQID